ncbi:MAG: DinB family protein [Bacteroidota bacterium]
MKINRKTVLKSFLASLISIPAFSKNTENELLVDVKKDIFSAMKNSEKYTLTVYNQMPEDKLNWKYTPESFSFRTQFVHCITFTASQLCGRMGLKNPYDSKSKEYWETLTKLQLESELKEFYSWLGTILIESNQEKLAKEEPFVGGNLSMWKIFYAMENHIIHHRGQAICYLRLNGITPIGYIGWA